MSKSYQKHQRKHRFYEMRLRPWQPERKMNFWLLLSPLASKTNQVFGAKKLMARPLDSIVGNVRLISGYQRIKPKLMEASRR